MKKSLMVRQAEHKKGNRPESLLNDDGCISTLLVPFVLLVGTVAILNDGCRLSASPEALLGVVATKLTLNENGCLRHSLVVHELQ